MIDGLPKTGQDYKVWDSQTPGFHVRVLPSGRKNYAYFYRTAAGEQRTITFGKAVPGIKLEAMRREAQALMVKVHEGGDPSGDRRASARSTRMAELFNEYLEKHAKPRKKERSVAEDERNWRVHLAPRFSKMRIEDVDKRSLDGFMSAMHDKRGAANRCMALMSKL